MTFSDTPTAFGRHLRRVAVAASLTSWILLWVPAEAGPIREARSEIGAEKKEVFPYRMNGKVRILFFWLGKDDVGGGHITLSRRRPQENGPLTERIEVLFGSKPERVPGKHNRWGYAFETSYWRQRGPDGAPELERTVFEGFMRRSKETSISEVQKASNTDGANPGYAFSGTRSEIRPTGATAEIRYFTTTENFDYRHAAPIREGYEKRLQAGPPDKLKTLKNPEGREAYRAPFGFLGATRYLLSNIVEGFQHGSKTWKRVRPSEIYVHNAKRFRLRVKDIDYKKTFRIDLPGERAPEIRDVASVQFRIEEIGTGYKHDFNVWIPLRGELSGIPVKIVDKPRWWLRVELELDPDDALLAALVGGRSDSPADASGDTN